VTRALTAKLSPIKVSAEWVYRVLVMAALAALAFLQDTAKKTDLAPIRQDIAEVKRAIADLDKRLAVIDALQDQRATKPRSGD
jgi:septal ring factor EnvC (AmiA/AmiB activator)